MPSGMITKGIGGFYYVAAGDEVYECKARGRFRKDEITPLPGDRVTFSVLNQRKRNGFLEEILPRENVLERPAVANVSQMIAVLAAKSPEPDFLLLDKLLLTAAKKNVKTAICINKTDLDNERSFLSAVKEYEGAGYCVIPASAKTGEGMDKLKSILKENITVLAGQSGVGKSSLLNRLMESQLMQTGEVSEKINRGKHTTRHAEVIALENGGWLVDTPGFSSFELSGISLDELSGLYEEFDPYLGKCRFNGCSHISEPDCAVKEALKDGSISNSRYDRYTALFAILKEAGSRLYK